MTNKNMKNIYLRDIRHQSGEHINQGHLIIQCFTEPVSPRYSLILPAVLLLQPTISKNTITTSMILDIKGENDNTYCGSFVPKRKIATKQEPMKMEA